MLLKFKVLAKLFRNKFPNYLGLIKPTMEVGKIVIPSKVVQNMKVLDKSAFDTKLSIPYVKTTTSNIQNVTKLLKPFMLKLEKIKPVQNEENSDRKIVLLNPEKSLSVMTSEDCENLAKLGVDINELSQKEITVQYENWKTEDILRAIIPPDLPTVSGFSLIGHILHLNLRNHHEEYKKIIAQVLLDKTPRVRTIVNKINTIDSTYRNFQMEVLAGDPETIVKVKENGITFEFDFATVYWNPRLSTEHSRIVAKIKAGDIVFDVFCGVGPFAIPAAKKNCVVYANDLNPESYKWLCHNVKLNKVNIKNFNSFNLNASDFITSIIGPKLKELTQSECNIHIVMNLPATGVEFLTSFKGLIPDLNIDKLNVQIHSYCFIKDATNFGQATKLVEDNLGSKLTKDEVLEIVHVRNVAPNKEMIRVSFNLPKQVLINKDCCNNSEPPIKKLKV